MTISGALGELSAALTRSAKRAPSQASDCTNVRTTETLISTARGMLRDGNGHDGAVRGTYQLRTAVSIFLLGGDVRVTAPERRAPKRIPCMKRIGQCNAGRVHVRRAAST